MLNNYYTHPIIKNINLYLNHKEKLLGKKITERVANIPFDLVKNKILKNSDSEKDYYSVFTIHYILENLRKKFKSESIVKIREVLIKKLLNLHQNFTFADLRRVRDPRKKLLWTYLFVEDHPHWLAENLQLLNLERIPLKDKIALITKFYHLPKKQLHSINLSQLLESLGILEEIRAAHTFEKRLNLLKQFYTKKWLLSLIMENFDKIGFIEDIRESTCNQERVEKLKCMIADSEWLTIAIIRNFSKFGLEELSEKMLTEGLLLIASRGVNAATTLAVNSKLLNLKALPFEMRIKIACLIALQGNKAEMQLAYHFEHFGFDQDIKKCWSFSFRLKKARLIAEQGKWAKGGVLNCFSELGFIEDIRNCKTLKEVFYKLSKVSGLGNWAILGLSENFDDMDLMDKIQKSSDPFNHLMKFAKIGDWMVKLIAETLSKRQIQQFTLKERLSFAFTFAKAGSDAAVPFIESIHKWKLNELDSSTLLKLTSILIENGEEAAVTWIKNHAFTKLGFQDLPFKKKLDLIFTLVRKGEIAAKAVLCVIYDLKITKHLSNAELFELAKEIAKQGLCSAVPLALHRCFPFTKLKIQDRVRLATLIVQQGEDAVKALFMSDNLKSLSEAGFEKLVEWIKIAIVQGNDAMTIVINSLNHLFREEFLLRQAVVELFSLTQKESLKKLVSRYGIGNLKPAYHMLCSDTFDDSKGFERFLSQNPKYRQLLELYKITMTKADNPSVQVKLLRWIAYTACILFDLSDELADRIEETQLLKQIFLHQHPKDRFSLVRQLYFLANEHSEDIQKINSPKLKEQLFHGYAKIAWMLLARLKHLGVDEKALLLTLNLLSTKNKLFKVSRYFHDFVELVVRILRESPFTIQEKVLIGSLLSTVFKEKENNKIKNQLRSLCTILSLLGKKEFFICIQSSKGYDLYLTTVIPQQKI